MRIPHEIGTFLLCLWAAWAGHADPPTEDPAPAASDEEPPVKGHSRLACLTYTPPMEPEVAERGRRPAGLWLLTIVLLTSPVLQSLALFFHKHWLNFGSHHAWDGFVYLVIAPVVGGLMLSRHERARFSVYVFLSCEILRAIRIHSGLLGVLAAGSILYLQLPAARRFHPAIDPGKVMARLRLRPPTV